MPLITIIITKLLLCQYPRKESSLVAHLVRELCKFIVKVLCKVHQQMIRCSGNWWWKETMLFDDLTSSESEFQRVGTATEKARVPAWVLTLGTDSKWKPDERSSLGLGDKESMENIYEGSLEERVLTA